MGTARFDEKAFEKALQENLQYSTQFVHGCQPLREFIEYYESCKEVLADGMIIPPIMGCTYES